MAIQGKGWLAVQMPDGTEGYTRNGSLEVNANGILQTRSGLPVLGSGGPITLPPDVEVVFGTDSTISTVRAPAPATAPAPWISSSSSIPPKPI
jgi:flagellar basal-body rod protein FlgF